MSFRKQHNRRGSAAAALALAAVAAGIIVASALARGAAPPALTLNPALQGPSENPFVGDTLRATNGGWNGNPTKFTYQWDRCAAVGDRQGCAPIAGATSQSYTVKQADVDHTLRARVTARNADGSTTKDTKGTGVVWENKAPANKARPKVMGTANVGSTLTADAGTWGGATDFSYQWQSCDANGGNCEAISGATGKSYNVRSSDRGNTLRVQVTGRNKFGNATSTSDRTNAVGAGGGGGNSTGSCTNGNGTLNASGLELPQRLLIDRFSFSPNVVTPSTQTFTARIHVGLTNGCSVAGAKLWATAIPYNQTNVAEGTTGADGWGTLTFNMQGGFPANPGRQQILAMLVRSTKPGGSVLAGVSTRRTLAQRVSLR